MAFSVSCNEFAFLPVSKNIASGKFRQKKEDSVLSAIEYREASSPRSRSLVGGGPRRDLISSKCAFGQ